MKYFKLTLFVMTMLFVSFSATAQNLTVTGVVTDSSNGLGVPFAGVQLKGTTIGTVTDVDGLYSIEVPAEGILVFSSIGYKDLEVAVASNSKIDVQLHPDTEQIEETIVVAFGTATKESFTGSATVVKSSDIAKTQSSDATRALEGVVAGVQMTTTSGSLGSSPSIMVRGIGSMSAGTAPLYIVDGIPFSGDMNNLNASDIESMTVLKDAASNALYGARGANGVIMITTKKAKRGDAIINVDAKWGLNTKALKDYDVITDPGQYYEAYYAALRNYYEHPDQTMDADGNLTMSNTPLSGPQAHIKALHTMTGDIIAGGLGYIVYDVPAGQSLIGTNGKLNPNATLGRVVGYNDELFLLYPDNWIKEAYSNSLRQEYNVSISGSSDKISVLASFGYLNNHGIIDGADMSRYTARLRADYQAKNWLKIGANVSYSNFKWNDSGNSGEGDSASTGNIFAIATGIAPIYPAYIRDAEGNIKTDKYGFLRYDYGEGQNGGMLRPYMGTSNALQGTILDKNTTEGNYVNGTAFAEVKFLKDFTFTFNAGIGVDERRSTSIMNKYYGMAAPVGGMISKSHSRLFTLNLQQLLNWKRTFAGVHNVSVLLGHETFNEKSYGLNASKSQMFSMENDELNGAVVDSKNSGSSFGEYNNEGYFIRAQYDYANRIFASVSFRRDASSKFHPDHRWGNFWSLGGGWLINHESWFPRLPWLDMLKVKASVGSQGNDKISSYLYTDTFSLGNNQNKPAISFGTKGNENITWETNTNFNAGIDFDLLRGRISGTVEYFYRKTSDMLFLFSTPLSIGYSGYYDNIGDMRNSGIELSTNIGLYRNENINWNFYLNLTHYTNKITMLPEDKKTLTVEGYEGYASGNRYVGEGLALYTFYLPKYAGVDQETGKSMWWKDIEDEKGNVTSKEKTTEYTEATHYICGAPTPDLYGGFGTSIDFFGFDFSASFTYSIGGLSYDYGYASYMASPLLSSLGSNFHKDVFKSWSHTNKDSDIPRFQYQDQHTAASSDRFLMDASYLNFQNAQLGYTLPERITRKMHIGKLRIYVACDNIIYWSRRNGFDPRFSFAGETNNAVNSPVRTVSGGLNITF